MNTTHYGYFRITELLDSVINKRMAAAWVRAEANDLIEQLERRARGWDKGQYRDDDVMRDTPIRQRIRESVTLSFALAKKFAEVQS
jgi:hypothetical protein